MRSAPVCITDTGDTSLNIDTKTETFIRIEVKQYLRFTEVIKFDILNYLFYVVAQK